MKLKVTIALLALMLLAFVPATVSAATHTNSLVTGVTQTVPGVGTFTGSITTTGFQLVNGVVNAVGTITGSLTGPTGAALGSITNVPISIPLTGFTGTCDILSLHTGAINLTLLGLNVSLAPIDLVITATAAPGNLLGNLLCAVVHLLDSNGSLTAITGALNHILSAL